MYSQAVTHPSTNMAPEHGSGATVGGRSGPGESPGQTGDTGINNGKL